MYVSPRLVRRARLRSTLRRQLHDQLQTELLLGVVRVDRHGGGAGLEQVGGVGGGGATVVVGAFGVGACGVGVRGVGAFRVEPREVEAGDREAGRPGGPGARPGDAGPADEAGAVLGEERQAYGLVDGVGPDGGHGGLGERAGGLGRLRPEV
ncbi:hypothetical protein [Barrientosiimonas endolithica]|uniref:Uncharacterized protein n=1 Tax=Barrientosiimonas endolithica TaxID=1535208 RepID=A0ABM8H7K3_9MICO|nr:hypothetical protein GCM10025872_04820 [Barrientosiimonas endolithica]